MKRLLCLLVIGISTIFARGLLPLFDGRSLSGWTPEEEARWTVVQGALVSDRGGDGWLRSNKTYTDFILKCEYRNPPKQRNLLSRDAEIEAGRAESARWPRTTDQQ